MKKNTALRIKYSSMDIFLYLILIPFLHPRGFDEYFSAYKAFFTLWLYGSVVLIFFLFIYKISRYGIPHKKFVYFMLLYYGLFITITFLAQGGINEGLQKLFMAPALCMLCIMCLQRNRLSFLRCISNILIINFLLNVTIFSPYIFKSYFAEDTHILFVGHVQVAAQLGIIGIFIGYLLHKIYPDMKYKPRFLIILSVITMLMSNTSASFISLGILVVGAIILYFRKNPKVLSLDSRLFIVGYLLMNILLICFSKNMNSIYSYYGLDFTFNGRTFIWNNALELLKSHMMVGYGAYGVLIRTFWSTGMNYVHNELLQRLLDGGIILLIAFLVMLFSYVSRVSRVENKRVVSFSNICLIAILFVMLFESVTEYYFVFIFLSLLAYLSEISQLFVSEKYRNV